MATTFQILRPDDLLALTIEPRNLRLDTSDPKNPALVVADAKKPAYLIIQFPPQNISEQAFFESSAISSPPYNTPPPPPDPGPIPLAPPGSVSAIMAGPSRLVFEVPASVKRIPYSIEALLDWSVLRLNVSAVAKVPPKGPVPLGLTITPPKDVETAIEMPYRLILSPNSDVGWLHASAPVSHNGRTELWHTRMARLVSTGKPPAKTRVDPTELNPIPLRAIWSPDFVADGPIPSLLDVGPFLSSLAPGDRDQIVILTSGFNGYYIAAQGTRLPFVPRPINASRVFLSALGGWLDSRGDWNPLPSYDFGSGQTDTLALTEWVHHATEGRDHYVKVVYQGYLYPFGHRASLVKVTERKFIGGDEGVVPSPTAYLRQRMYVVVREPVKTYKGAPYTFKGLEMPFAAQVKIKTRVTPNIDQPSLPPSPVIGASDSFWINVGQSGFPFHLAAQDLAGAAIDFTTPLIFVPNDEQNLTAVQTQYAASTQRSCKVRSKNVTYADPTAGDTKLKTSEMFFDTQLLRSTQPFGGVAPFIPKLDAATSATVTIPALTEMLGIQGSTQIHLYQGYLTSGLDSHAGVYASLNNPPSVAFPADKSGGFATPTLSVTGMSARKGLVGGNPDDAANGLIDPTAFFDVTAKLFGTIPLQNLVPLIAGSTKANAAQNAPEIRSQDLPNSKNPQTITTKVHWAPQLQDYPPPSAPQGALSVNFNQNGAKSELTLLATLERHLDGTPPLSQVHGKLSNFLITLFGVVGLKITSITFDSKNGGKMNVAAELPASKPIEFLGALAFVQQLSDILPPGIFGGSGPSIRLTPTFIRATITIGLPPISVGVLALENIAITTGLDLPYLDGKPGFEFAFASRGAPFLLTVECLGGGGFVHLIINADGVQMVEGALEFGGEFSIDLGVASGGVHIMAGIYFQLKSTTTTLTGFVDIGGEVSVLGIISVSIDLNLSLSFIHSAQGDKVQGRATLTISVHIVFFSISVSVSVEKSYGSGSGDPKVFQLIGPTDWASYAEAFA
jgi:hypothetical protein